MGKPGSPIEQCLRIELDLTLSTATVGEAVQARVVLTNCGSAAIVVNGRLGMGYRDSDDRELYCEIYQEDQVEYLGYEAFRVDYRRKELDQSFFPTLEPDESIEASYDLNYWYRITEPGLYQVRVIYDPEPYPPIPEAAVGPIFSEPVTITIVA